MIRSFMRFLRRNTIALLALFLALGGTTYAASNALLPKNSVGTAQLKNGAVTKKKINKKTIKALKGNRGAKGAPGAQGVQGNQGPIGPSTGYSVDSGNDILSWTGGTQTVQSLSLPAGSYVLLGKLIANNNSASNANVNCQLSLNGVVDNGFDVVTTGTSGDDRHYMVMAGTKTIAAPATATMACTTSATSGNYLNRVITAVKVGALG
jgi:hypothetical protein